MLDGQGLQQKQHVGGKKYIMKFLNDIIAETGRPPVNNLEFDPERTARAHYQAIHDLISEEDLAVLQALIVWLGEEVDLEGASLHVNEGVGVLHYILNPARLGSGPE